MTEFSSESGDYSLCDQVLLHLWTLIDGEVTEDCTAELARTLLEHVKKCPPCEDNFQLEEQILGLIGSKCRGERAPESLRARLRIEISRTTIIQGR